MSYRYDKRKQSRNRWYVIGGILLLVMLFTPFFSWSFDVLERFFEKTWNDQQSLAQEGGNIIQSFYNKQGILEENTILKNEIKRLEVDNLRIGYLSQELEEISLLTNGSTSNIIPGNVIRRDVLGNSDVFIVNQGSKDGVTIGDSVVTYDHVLIGFIDSVYDHTSQLTLHSKANQTIDGVLFPHNVTMSARGYGNGSFVIDAPREVAVAEGDILYSLEQPGSIVAIVRDIVFDPRDPFKQVYLSYPVNTNQIQKVGIKKTPFSTIVE